METSKSFYLQSIYAGVHNKSSLKEKVKFFGKQLHMRITEEFRTPVYPFIQRIWSVRNAVQSQYAISSVRKAISESAEVKISRESVEERFTISGLLAIVIEWGRGWKEEWIGWSVLGSVTFLKCARTKQFDKNAIVIF